jgi:hypothetical protein
MICLNYVWETRYKSEIKQCKLSTIELSITHHIFQTDKVGQWLATGRWFSPGTPVSSNNKTDRHDITEILLKVALNTTNQTNHQQYY